MLYINLDKIKIRKEFFGALLFDFEEFNYYILNSISIEILSMFLNGNTLDNVKNIIKKKYKLSDILYELDIMPLINSYIKKEYLVEYESKNFDNYINNNVVDGRLSAPIEVTLNPHYMCNQNCKFCYAKDLINNKKYQHNILELNDYKLLLTSPGWKDAFCYHILGGEPFVNKDLLFGILDILGTNHCISITTNGTACYNNEKEIALRLKKYKNLEIAVSLESSIEDYHNKVTGNKDGYKKIIKFVKELVKYVKNVSINTVITKENIEYIYETAVLAKSLGVRVFSCSLPIPCNNINIDEYLKNNVLYEQVIELEKELRTLESENFFIVIYYNDFKNNDIKDNKFNLFKGCSAGNRGIEILPNGDVYPCCAINGQEKFLLGNIKSNSFYEIWENPKLESFRNKSGKCGLVNYESKV